MTREEMLAIAKPILFNTEMVQAIRDNRKTATRRPVKLKGYEVLDIDKRDLSPFNVYATVANEDTLCGMWIRKPYLPRDILYVPEAWKCSKPPDPSTLCYEVAFRDGAITKFQFTDRQRFDRWQKYWDKPDTQWQSPYFMPKEAARIFLRVTDVRVERLQDMTDDDVYSEGAVDLILQKSKRVILHSESEIESDALVASFGSLVWNSTIPKHPNKFKRYLYYWEDNPRVWVIEFERVEAKK